MIKDNYLYTNTYNKIEDFILDFECTYIYAHSAEDRSCIADGLKLRKNEKINFIELIEIGNDKIHDLFSKKDYNLRDNDSIFEFFKQFSNSLVYIDSSGLTNRVCAPLLKNAFNLFDNLSFKDIRIIYAEPDSYQIVKFSTEGIFHDLSESIQGIDPLPGFANILPYDSDSTMLVALLGFEGGRFKYILDNIEVNKTIIHPVIGVPGFRPEYPFVAYWGNRSALDNSDIWANIRYANANSIPDIYNLLKKFLKESVSGRIKVAPIGTKPHAIGAILFALKYPLEVELIYDNPIRKKKKTEGIGKIIECYAYNLLKEK